MKMPAILPLFLVASMFTVTSYAQDEFTLPAVEEARVARFDPMVRVMDYEAQTGRISVAVPDMAPVQAESYKAYPYGSTFDVAPGVRCKLFFRGTTYVAVRGPAKITALQENDWSRVTLDVAYGDMNIFVDRQVQDKQFSIKTPLGSLEDVHGLCKLRMEKPTDGLFKGKDFNFLAQAGSARFVAQSVTTQPLANSSGFYVEGGKPESMTMVGAAGEVKLDFPAGNGATTTFSLTPGASAKITRAQPMGSKNWVVSVLTLHANGQAKDYFCYVENRDGKHFATGQILEQMLASEDDKESEETEDKTAAAPEETYDDEMSDFGDDSDVGLDDLDLGDGGLLE